MRTASSGPPPASLPPPPFAPSLGQDGKAMQLRHLPKLHSISVISFNIHLSILILHGFCRIFQRHAHFVLGPCCSVQRRQCSVPCSTEILEAPGSSHLVVTHKSMARAFLCTALALPPTSFRSLDMNNGGVSIFRCVMDTLLHCQ